MLRNGGTLGRFALLAAMAAALVACSTSEDGPSLPRIADLNPFTEKEKPLPGKRIAVLEEEKKIGELAPALAPIALPPERINEAWPQPGGLANNSPGHLVVQALRNAWSTSIGTGSSSVSRLVASPIVYDGKVFTLDAEGLVAAFSTNGGATLWRVSTTPKGEKGRKGFGGGIAAENGRIYAATGYGTLVALDAKSGKLLWEKSFGVPFRTSPTAAQDKIFVVTAEGRLLCVNGADGAELWSYRALPERASLLSNVSPAVEGDIVVVAYPSGEVVAVKIATGQLAWTESLSRTRTTSSFNALTDAARPVIDNGQVFAIGHGGRMIATSLKSGERLWSLSIPGAQPPWVAGESVFVVDVTGQLIAVARKDGKIQWTTKLPGAKTWSGPVLASGKLWLVSSTGKLVGVEAQTGKLAQTQEVGSPLYISPVIAGGRMYLLTDGGKLIAYN